MFVTPPGIRFTGPAHNVLDHAFVLWAELPSDAVPAAVLKSTFTIKSTDDPIVLHDLR